MRYYRSITLWLDFIWNCERAVSILGSRSARKLVIHNRGYRLTKKRADNTRLEPRNAGMKDRECLQY